MAFVHRTPTSIRDFREIWLYIASQNREKAADQLVAEFEQTLLMLSDHPRAGTARPELQSRPRSYPVGNYLLFYKPMRGGIQLVRVPHGARDLRRIFKR